MTNILSKYLNFYADCYFEDGFKRDYGDSRDGISGFGVVNATFIGKKFLKCYDGLELRGSVYNLLDKEWSTQTSQGIPKDLPGLDRHYLLEMKYTF